MMKIPFLVLMASAALSACTPPMVEKLPYYKLTVVQGVPFDAQRVAGLREGMSRAQVQMEIGAPLLNPSFRQDQWSYVYQLSKGGKVQEILSLNITFDGDSVSNISGTAWDYAQNQGKNDE